MLANPEPTRRPCRTARRHGRAAIDAREARRLLATFYGTGGDDTIEISSPTSSFAIVTINAADGARANQGALP